MAINIYSKDSVDNLLADKLSDAPSDGSTYGRKDGAWEVVSGGGSFNGGAIDNPITIAGATYDSEMSSDFFGVELSSDNSKYGELTYNSLTVVDGAASTTVSPTNVVTTDGANGTTSVNIGAIDIIGATPTDEISISANDQSITLYTSGSALSVTATGITFPDSTIQTTAAWTSGSGDLSLGGYSLTNGNVDCSAGYVTAQNVTLTSGGVLTFPDSTVQTTAAVAGANFGDAFTLGKVQDVSASSGYWQITFAPVNSPAMMLGLSVSLSDGTSSESITSFSSSSTWTYTTTGLSSSDYIYITYNGQRSSIAISNP